MWPFKEKKIQRAPVPREDLTLDEIIKAISNSHDRLSPNSDALQSLLFQMGSDFKITNQDDVSRGTNVDKVLALSIALLFKHLQESTKK